MSMSTEKKTRTRRLESQYDAVMVLVNDYPAHESAGIYLSLRAASEALWRAVEISQEAEAGIPESSHRDPAQRMIQMIDTILNNSVPK